MLTKFCVKCESELPLDDAHFGRDKNRKSGFYPTCKGCRNNYQSGVRGLLNQARHRAKRQSLPFDLVEQDIHIPSTCPVLGIPLFIGVGSHSSNSPSLDKFIPSKGYVRGNVYVISHRANMLKNDATLKESRLITKWMERISHYDS
jgi:hypothetical protein